MIRSYGRAPWPPPKRDRGPSAVDADNKNNEWPMRTLEFHRWKK